MSSRISSGLGIGVIIAVAAAGIGGGYFYVSQAQKQFSEEESEMPESAISTYLENIRTRSYDQIYQDSLIIAPHLNSESDYVAKLEEIYSGISISSIEYAPDNTDTSKYRLYSNKKYLSTLDLVKASDGRWLASTEFSGDQNYTVEVPTGLGIEVNGLPVDSSYMTAENTVASNFTQITNQSNAPHVDTYTFKNLLGKPEIAVTGNSSYTTLQDVLSDTLFIGKVSNEADLATQFTNAAVTLASYPTRDGSLGDIANICITDSEFYSRLSSLQNTWFSDHGTSSFSNVTASDIIQQSDDTMVGYVTFDYYAANSEVDRTWHGGYQLSFMRVNGAWKLAGMGIDNELNPAKEAIPTQN
ncbi:MAG: hypothetical protein EOM64_06525 [Erysipelotrichia bacterium]|nr:hypothetical protein [Erysipelotrichia bacterium]